MAIGTDAPPYILFWNPYGQKSPYTLPFPNTHTGKINDLKCANNSMLISTSNDNQIENWNYANATKNWDTKMPNEQNAIEIVSSDKLVIGATNGVISECAINTGVCQQLSTLHTNIVNSFELLNNGDLVSGTEGGYAIQWTKGNYATHKNIFFVGDPINSLKRLPNGNMAFGLANGSILVHNISDNLSFVLEFKAHLLAVNALELLPNGNLASGSSDKSIKIWNCTSFNLTGQLNNHTKSVNALKVLSNNLLASGSDDHTIKVWNTISMSRVNEVNIGHPVKALELLRNTTFSNSTPNRIFKKGVKFIFSQLSFSEQTELLNSKYDLSECLVNCTCHGYCKFDLASDSFLCACDEY